MTHLGIFDSGIGGLTVLKAILEKFTTLSTTYLADQAHFPYGTKSAQMIIDCAMRNAAFLENQGATAILIACHTASAYALKPLQSAFSLPVFGMVEPTVQLALAASKKNRIAVLGSEATISSGAYEHMIPIALQTLIDAIEMKKVSDRILIESMEKIKLSGADTAILACTHFAHVEKEMHTILGDSVKLINPTQAIVKNLAQKLIFSPGPSPKHAFFTSALDSEKGKKKFDVQFFPQNG